MLEQVIGADGDAEDFWVQAERNLRGGVLRLVFVADVIPDELRAVIEFLNARMHDTEVFGVEVRRQECLEDALVCEPLQRMVGTFPYYF